MERLDLRTSKEFLVIALFSYTLSATCAVTGIWESLVIGAVGAVLVLLSDAALRHLHIDDPVSAVPVHGVAGIWGLLAAGFFTHKDTITEFFSDRHGLAKVGASVLHTYLSRVECSWASSEIR